MHRGAKLLLDGGRIRISTDTIILPREFDYGVNTDLLKVFVLSYVKFLCDSPLELTNPKPAKVYMRFYKRLTTENIRSVIRLFSGYADEILKSEFSSGSDSSTRVFHEFMTDTPIFKEYHQWIMTGRPELLKYVLSFLRFGKKLAYVDKSLDATAFHGWLEVEDRLRTLKFSDEDTASLRTIIAELVGPLHIDHLLPKFGTGNVSEAGVTDVYKKLKHLSTDRKLEYAFFRERPFRGSEEGFDSQRVIRQRGNSLDIARLKFVPKDITKSRSICMEPNAYMYFQQEVHRWMRYTMDHSVISRFVTLNDQTANQQAAIHGSTYLSSDTIDLSSASDSVHAELVRRIFPPDWLFYMFATRSYKVKLLDGEIRQVEKFAPMGSAVCFPTQCIIFTAVCIYAYLAYTHRKTTGSWICTKDDVVFLLNSIHKARSGSTPFTRLLEPPVVYGDDIIVDSRTTSIVIATLERLGFAVNVDKSFTGSSSFRESCGVYAYEGLDVTPVLFRLPFFRRGDWDAKVYASFIGSINEFRKNGYHAVASFLLSILKDYGFKYPLPFSSNPNAFGLFTLNKHKVNPKFFRFNASWQVNEELVQSIGPRKTKRAKPENLDAYSLDQWWRSRVTGDLPLLLGEGLVIRPQETRLAPTWARCE